MSLFSIFLVFLSACLHVILHIAIKRARDRMSFVWWMWLWASILFIPVPVFFWQSGPAAVWAILIVSAIFEALYHVSITRAYKTGDLSIVYPLARGTAPLFILLWSSLLLDERPSAGGVCGIILIFFGLYIVNLPRLGAWREARRALNQSATRWALLAGVCISLYTTVDKAGVSMIAPLLYTYLVMALTLVWLTPGTIRAVGIKGLMAEWKCSRLSAAVAGLASVSAYAIVLSVMRMGVPASYVGAAREMSIVLSAVAGIIFLRERGTVARVAGCVLIAIGVGAIAALG